MTIQEALDKDQKNGGIWRQPFLFSFIIITGVDGFLRWKDDGEHAVLSREDILAYDWEVVT